MPQESSLRPRRRPKRPPKEAPRSQNCCFSFVFSRFLATSLFRRSDAPRTSKGLPKRLQDGPPRPGESPQMAQQGLKTTPEPPEKRENGPEKAPTGAPDSPRAFQDAHR